jgi:alkylation response protein AidB-like acyl-CoA dehydrogenase
MAFLTENQQSVQSAAAEFCRRNLSEQLAREHDEQERYPRDLLEKLAAQGLLGVIFPEKSGGSGLGYLETGLVLEELGYHMLALATAYVQNVIFGGTLLDRFGTDEQRELLPDLMAARKFFCLAATEPEAGSDLAALRSRAELRGDEYILNGSKLYCTGAHIADYILVLARTDPEAQRQRGLSLLLVKQDSPGVTVQPLPKLGMKAVGTNSVFFDEVRVPAKNLLGGVAGEGWRQVLWMFDRERAMVACTAVGAAQAVTDLALAYAKERVQFGKPIGAFQAVQHRIVEMQIQVDLARLMARQAALELDSGSPSGRKASTAKVVAAKTLATCASECMLVLGGNSFISDSPAQRFYRDAKFVEIAGGTPDIHYIVIARSLGLPV